MRIRYSDVAREILRALRGPRSQQAYARRLGYRSNVPAQWESGRRVPPMAAVERAARAAGIDWALVFERFHPQTAGLVDDGLATWLQAHKGRASHASVARTCSLSPHQVGRIVRGESDPRLHEYLELVQVLTGRVADWVAALVPIEQVPSLASLHREAEAASNLMYERPWAAAVLVGVGVRQPDPDPAPSIAVSLGLPESNVVELLERLQDVALVVRRPGGLCVREALSLDTPPTAAQVQGMRAHWGQVAADRLGAPLPTDRYHYTVCNVSHADLDRIQALYAATYRQVRAIVAASEGPEVSALVSSHVLTWPAGDSIKASGRGPA